MMNRSSSMAAAPPIPRHLFGVGDCEIFRGGPAVAVREEANADGNVAGIAPSATAQLRTWGEGTRRSWSPGRSLDGNRCLLLWNTSAAGKSVHFIGALKLNAFID